MKEWEYESENKGVALLSEGDPEKDNKRLATAMQKILEANTTEECRVLWEIAMEAAYDTGVTKGKASERKAQWKAIKKKRKQERDGWIGEDTSNNEEKATKP